MAIIGIERLVYGVADVAESARFFNDFGLVRDVDQTGGDEPRYVLPDGSRVVLRRRDDASLARSRIVGDGVHEVIWGVRDAASFERLCRGLSTDREVTVDDEGIARFETDFGVPMGLRIFVPYPIRTAPDPLNSPGNVNRLNQHRKWRLRAKPRTIAHVVFACPDYEAGDAFMRERLEFRLSDAQRGFGRYLRAPGSTAHHNLLLLNANAPVPDMDGQLKFHHANFGVEDIDEIMVGANYMARKGWKDSHWGLGRHRIDSALFYYVPSPAGGEAEYGADQDAADDNWVPRYWTNPLFGFAHFVSNMPPFFLDEPDWSFHYITDGSIPSDAETPAASHA